MCETFQPTVERLLFCATFEVDPFEEQFFWSLGQQLKPMNVNVALPHYTVHLICNAHTNISCAINFMSLNCIVFILKYARYFLHVLYILCVYAEHVHVSDVSAVTGLLFYHTVIMFCLRGISALGRCSRYARGCVVFDSLITCGYSTSGNPRKHGNRIAFFSWKGPTTIILSSCLTTSGLTRS